MTDHLKETNYIDLTQPSNLNELNYEKENEKKFEFFKSFNTHVDECINLIDDIDEKQEDEIRGDSHFGIKKQVSCLKDEIHDNDFSLTSGKSSNNEKNLKTNEIVNKKRKKKPSKVIPWTKAEEGQLMQAIETHGTKWSVVREAMGCKRAAYCYQSHWNVMKKRL
ncbi:20578_t:CDS:2 [Cetraspora pellucida]|uniref:20578_t:CDS:1 n=1 Tax=Cetraspora pellucida TaxID=1433469 RepID=A0A9N9BG44_9GLOM|nr:20578_t:CDS:2 [Cetraspora pellucida]